MNGTLDLSTIFTKVSAKIGYICQSIRYGKSKIIPKFLVSKKVKNRLNVEKHRQKS